ncbi:tubulointerstitial nephritis antigen-like [Styela clava]
MKRRRLYLKCICIISILNCYVNSVDTIQQSNEEYFVEKSSDFQSQFQSDRIHIRTKRQFTTKGVFLSLVGPRPVRPYCAGRYDKTGRSQRCCSGRDDACRVPFYDTACYCDEFCYRNRAEDCCPDYVNYCFSVGFETSTKSTTTSTTSSTSTATQITSHTKPQTEKTSTAESTETLHTIPMTTLSTTTEHDLSQEVCYNKGAGYRLDDKIKLNCNECICQRIINGYYKFACEENTCLIQPNLIEVINGGEYGWTAGNYSFFWGETLDNGIRYRLGTKRAPEVVRNMTGIKIYVSEELPKEFDARLRWPSYILPPRDQGNCGSSWAFSTTSVASDRLAIQSNGLLKPDLSPQHLLSCRHKMKKKKRQNCRKERVDRAWWFLRRKGAVSSECYPFTAKRRGKVRKCRFPSRRGKCPSKKGTNKVYKMGPSYKINNNVLDIMKEIKDNGPVQATMKITQDFFMYKSGIYNSLPFPIEDISNSNKRSYHSVKIVGWGEERNRLGSLMKYWIVQNSWGKHWGEKGYFRINKGSNTNEIESMIIAVWPKVDEEMMT